MVAVWWLAVYAVSTCSGPPISAASAIAIDAESGRVLCEKAADVPRFPASTTKVLTGLMLLERLRSDEVVVAPSDTERVGGASLYMKPGERLRAGDLLAAILLRSANDACHALAVHLSGNEAAFAKAMNERARQIGCRNTHFTNPHGLHDPRHYSSARDLALIAREAMRLKEFRSIVGRRRIAIERPAVPQDALMVSRNRYLALDPTADGVKTGWTVPAGKCYVGSAMRQGVRVITVLLKSEDWLADQRALLDWCFANYSRVPLASRGSKMGRAPVIDGKVATVDAQTRTTVWGVARRGGRIERRVHLAAVQAPVAAGTRVGRAEFWQAGAVVGAVDLVAGTPVERNGAWLGWAAAVGAASTVVFMRRPRRRRYGQ